jgi:hypothetical protein
MRNVATCLLVLCCLGAVQAQGKLPREAEQAVRVGRLLHRSELASWHGTDILRERHAALMPRIGGYFSYAEGERTICLFYSREDVPKALIRFAFDGFHENAGLKVDTAQGPLRPVEQELLAIRQRAMDLVRTDDLFELYEGINFNLIPVMDGKLRQVYILSGPKRSGIVVLGNDYLITFDRSNKVKEKRKLHKNIQVFEHGDMEVTTTMHSHLPETGAFITATDICTLLLYADIAGWPQHIVLSNTHVSIWDCKKQELMVMDRKAWDRIHEDQERRHAPER